MPPKKRKISRSSSARALERPRKQLREALEAFRARAGSCDCVAETLWSLLKHEEKESLRVQCLPSSQSEGGSSSSRVVQTVASYAAGNTSEAVAARGLLAKAGQEVFKKKSKAQQALKMKFSRRVWSKVCMNKLGAKKRGRKNKLNDPDITKTVREFLLATLWFHPIIGGLETSLCNVAPCNVPNGSYGNSTKTCRNSCA